MPADLREVLHRAAAAPAEPLGLERVLALGRRRQQRRQRGAVAISFVLVGIAASTVLAIPGPAPDTPGTSPDDPRPNSGAPRPGPSVTPGLNQFAALPSGWTELPAPPEVRSAAVVAWTGQQVLMWGGWEPDLSGGEVPEASGFSLDPGTGSWQEMAPSPLAPRGRAASAWTGSELLVWGGTGPGTTRYDDGAAYDPRLGTWRPLPPAPTSARAPLSGWTGQELIVWGTAVRDASIPRDGAAYHPATDSWRTISEGPVELTDAVAAWTGDEMIVFGAALSQADNSSRTETAVGAAYDPTADTWRRLPDSELSPQASTAAWNGKELIAWDYQIEAAAYDPAGNQWRPLPEPPLDPLECYPESVPVGADVFGEFCGGMVVYDTGQGRWHNVHPEEVTGPATQAWHFAVVAADPVVLLLGWSGDQRTMLAYRPPPRTSPPR